MNARMVQVAYLLGISLLLTSILYFFASNWPYFERMTKIALALLLIVLFYSLHLSLEKWVTWQPFLSNWTLVAASIVFGISVAVVGQTYNSHADSYELFLVWFIPVFLLAMITRYVPFYVLSYALSQLTMLFFIFPSAIFPAWNEDIKLMMLLGVMGVNALLFLIFYQEKLTSKTILYMAYIMFFGISFYVAVQDTFSFHISFNVFYFLTLIGTIYYFIKQHFHKGLLTVTSMFAASFLLFRIIYWVLLYFGELILYGLLFLAIGLTFVGGLLIGLLNKNKMNRYLVSVLTVSVTIVTTLFAMIAMTGIFFILFPEATTDSLYFVALIVLIIPGLFLQMKAQYRYSLLGTGVLIAFFAGILAQQTFYHGLLLLFLGIGVYMIQEKGVKVLAYLFTNIVLGYILLDWFSTHVLFLVLFCLNATYYLVLIKEKMTNYAAFLIAAVSFLSLTIVQTGIGFNLIYSVLFLFAVPFFLFILHRNEMKAEWTVMFVLWFIFLGVKYYEYLWDLLHKSIAAFVLGGLFISLAYLIDRPNKTGAPTGSVVIYKKSLLLVVILVQLGFVSFQAISSEVLLQKGKEIKLELAPKDPRSLLQGDYLVLNYDINRLHEPVPVGKVKVALRKEGEVYRYAGYYRKGGEWNKNYEPQPQDVIINGTAYGNNQVDYGIETFFVPEGTGTALENEADYAYVRVGTSGNAIVERLE